MAKSKYTGGRSPRRDPAARRASSIKKRADEEFYDQDYDEYDYERSVKLANRGCLIAFALVMVILAAGLLWGFLFVSAELDGKNATFEGTKQVEIPTGAGGSIIGALLKDEGLIGYDAVFRFYARFNGAGGSFRAGTYKLTGGMTYDEILDTITVSSEDREEVDVMFVPGKTVWEYGEAVEQAGICTAQEFVDAANDIEEYSDIEFFQHLDYDPNTYFKAEGYMSPNTYTFYKDDTPQTICRRLYNQFNTELNNMTFTTSVGEVDFYERLEQQQLSLREAISLASVVEKEASQADRNQAMVAGVFWNRIRGERNTNELPRATLGSDVTYLYIENTIAPLSYGGNVDAVPSELYNAYYTGDDSAESREGPPAGPICNPSVAAIKSALQPSLEDNYFYFLTDYYGEYYYATTWAQHQANIATMEQKNLEFEAGQEQQPDAGADGADDAA